MDKKDKVKKFFTPFSFKNGTRCLVALIVVLSVIMVGICSYNINSITNTDNKNIDYSSIKTEGEQPTQSNEEYDNKDIKYSVWSSVKDVFVVILSILGLNLLLSVCIERSNKNQAFEDFFTKDVISSPYFYEHMPEKDKEKMLHALEANHYYKNNNIPNLIHDSITKKLKNALPKEYYINKCQYNIKCSVFDDYIEKEIIKKISILPISERPVNIKKFKLLTVRYETIAEKQSVELVHAKINGKQLDLNKDIKSLDVDNTNVIEKKSGYVEIKNVYLKEKLKFEFENNKVLPKYIEIKYITRVPKNDLTYVCRMTAPCKDFSLKFEIKGEVPYKVIGHGFGFIDDAKNSPNHDDDKEINLQFEDWIFPKDGVSIFLSSKEV